MTDLSDETRRLLETERLRDELPETEVDVAWQAFEERLPAMTRAGVPSLGEVPEASVATATGGAARIAKLGALLLVTFGAGVMIGTLLPREPASVAQPAPSAPRSAVTMAASAPARAEVAVSVFALPSVPSPRAPAIVTALPSVGPSVAPASAPSSRPADVLSEERVLVEGARTALLRGRPSDALSLARKHETQFPNGELAEDRDFMIASSLQELGRLDEARAEARQFLVRYPKSALRRTVENIAAD